MRLRRVSQLWLALLLFDLWSIARADTIHVPGDAPTIQQAVDNASPGDTIQVSPGEYDEVVTMRSGLTLLGGAPGVQVRQTVWLENVENVTIFGIEVMGGNEDSHFGVFCRGAQARLQEMHISGFHHGISAENSHLSVQDCEVSEGFSVGIVLSQATEAVIEESRIHSSTVGLIVSVLDAQVHLVRNQITDNELGVRCNTGSVRLRGNLIADNFIGVDVYDADADLGTIESPGANRLLEHDGMAIRHDGRSPLPAQRNWWGRAEGPNPDQIVGAVVVEPWLRADPKGAFALQPAAGLHLTLWARLRRFHFRHR